MTSSSADFKRFMVWWLKTLIFTSLCKTPQDISIKHPQCHKHGETKFSIQPRGMLNKYEHIRAGAELYKFCLREPRYSELSHLTQATCSRWLISLSTDSAAHPITSSSLHFQLSYCNFSFFLKMHINESLQAWMNNIYSPVTEGGIYRFMLGFLNVKLVINESIIAH